MLRRRLAIEWLLVLLAAGLVVGLAANLGWTRAVDNRLYDLASGWAAPAPADDILIVEIDEPSLAALGRWPWPRAVHARLLSALALARPRAIGYDVLFLDPSPEDDVLADAMQRAGSVFLPALIGSEQGAVNVDDLVPPPSALARVAKLGAAEVGLDDDLVVRRAKIDVPVAGGRARQLGAMLALAARPGLALPAHQPFLVPFVPGERFRHVSFVHVVNGEVPAELLRDKIILVGATAEGMGDLYPVPSSAGGLMAGVQIQANLLNALLGGRTIAELPVPLLAIVSLLPVLLLMLGFLRFRPVSSLFLSIAVAAGIVLLCLALVPFAHLWVPPGAALLGVVLVPMLWGWRRLAAMSGFLDRQAALLQAEPGIARQPLRREIMSDRIAHEANELQAIIGQLRTLRLFTADVVERLPDATLVTDEHERIVLANAAACALFGADVSGLGLDAFLAKLYDGATFDGNRITGADGRTLVMSDAPLSGGGRIVRLADMTDLQRATDEREEVLQFLTHDLRAPHAAILTLLETRGRSAGVSSPQAGVSPEAIERIRGHARHGLRLADDFVQLARARRRPIEFVPCDLCDIAREAADMVWPRAVEREVQIVDGSETGEIWVMGDHAMLLRATVNLLENAVKFAPRGSRVDVAVTGGEEVRLVVSGPGPEMPAGRAARPFALYAEGRDVGGRVSIGLGLAFVQATASRHGGTAHYRHVDGFGATFSLVLPPAAEE